MIILFISSVVIFAVSNHGLQIHEKMTAKELLSIFRTNHNNVPEYEVVPVAHAVHRKSEPYEPYEVHTGPVRILQTNMFKQDIKLYLEPSDGFLIGTETPMWTARGDPDSPLGIKYTKISDSMDNKSQFYQDPINSAAIRSTYDENGEILFEGTIGDDYFIQPLPKRFRKISRSKRSVHDDFFSKSNRTVNHYDLKHTHDHIVYKKKQAPIEQSLSKIRSSALEKESLQSNHSTKERDILYPKVLVIVDYSKFLSLKTLDKVKEYVISFWNAVDLRYRIFVKPRIRINIAGIIVVTEPNGAPYIKKAQLNDSAMYYNEILYELSSYIFKEKYNVTSKRFDLEKDINIVAAMTNLDLCGGHCYIGGVSNDRGVCREYNNRWLSTLILKDQEDAYDGIRTAAHELGHLFGADHDHDTKRCEKEGYGFLMSPSAGFHPTLLKWSTCSLLWLNENFRSRAVDCLVEPPKFSKPLPRILPGAILSRDEQCDRLVGSKACYDKPPFQCNVLACYKKGTNDCYLDGAVAEGSDCGVNSHCLNGQCVSKEATEIYVTEAQEVDCKESLNGNC